MLELLAMCDQCLLDLDLTFLRTTASLYYF